MSKAIEIRDLSLRVNGQPVGPIPVPVGTSLLDFLHEWMGLTGSRMGCGQGICHACTVMVEEEAGPREMRTCITGAHWFEGRSVRTVEGHATTGAHGSVVLSPVQKAFVENFAFQCGYCTPGFVTGASVLIEKLKRKPVRRDEVERVVTDALDPHICRCTGYVRYHQAVRDLVLATPGLTIA
jgi:aerobic-type carbon monoxide dehydrogenase small subunit (CoxS/CutS family)